MGVWGLRLCLGVSLISHGNLQTVYTTPYPCVRVGLCQSSHSPRQVSWMYSDHVTVLPRVVLDVAVVQVFSSCSSKV